MFRVNYRRKIKKPETKKETGNKNRTSNRFF